MVDALLQTLGLVAFRHKGTGRSRGSAFLNTGSLTQGLVMGLDAINNDSPLAMDVDSSQGLDVLGVGGAQIGLLNDVLQSVDGVLSVGQHVLVQLLNGVVVVFNGLLDLVGGVFRVFQAVLVGLVGQEGGALGGTVVVRGGVVWLVGSGMVGSGVMRGSVVWGSVVGSGSVSGGGVAVGRGMTVDGGVGGIWRSGSVSGGGVVGSRMMGGAVVWGVCVRVSVGVGFG